MIEYMVCDSAFTFATLFCIVCVLLWFKWRKRLPNSPPGTNGLPLFGVLFSMKSFPERLLDKWRKIYGPLFMIKIGWLDVVVISSPKIAYEAFAKKECFNDRPQSIAFLEGDTGLVMINRNNFHKEQRRFALNTLREFGMGRGCLEPRLRQISNELCDNIRSKCGKNGISQPFDIQPLIYDVASSVISCMIFGEDMMKTNEEIRKMGLKLMQKSDFSFVDGLLMLAPFLKHFPVFSKAWKTGKDLQQKFRDEIRNEIETHQDTLDQLNPRDFIDCFLIEMEKSKKFAKTDCSANVIEDLPNNEASNDSKTWTPKSSFCEEQLISVVRDLFAAGMDTTACTICWILLYLCKFPSIQKKVQEEIDDVIGQSGVIQMSSVDKLPYTKAVIQEVCRLRPIAPLAAPHLASRDANLAGYRIPKGALILTNIWGIHHDETNWPEPERFLPERHLDENGKFVKSPNCMLFNVGARSCPGQQLAKMELFTFTVSLLQRFRFNLPNGVEPDMDGESRVTLKSSPFDLIATQR